MSAFRYLASLSADAIPTIIGVLPLLNAHDRCEMAVALKAREQSWAWGDWRSWNWSRYAALSALRAEGDDFEVRACRPAQTSSIR